MFKGWTMLFVILAVTALFAMVGTNIAAQKEQPQKHRITLQWARLKSSKCYR